MRLCILFVCVLQFSVLARGMAQDQVVTLEMQNVSYFELFNEIHQQTGLRFIYNTNQLEGMPAITVHADKQSVKDVLENIFLNTPFTFSFEQNVVMVKMKPTNEDEKKALSVKGFVYDEKKQPMPGVTVQVVGTAVGTATNAKGWFAITLPILKGKLKFSFVGYKDQEVEFSEKTDTLKIYLKEEISDLEEVQVIAYGERRKRDVISSISSVKAEEMKELPTANFINMLQGRMAGVEITSQSGSPGGGGAYIAIRGYNSLMVEGASDGQPLFVVDGVPMYSFVSPVTGTNVLADLDPSLIASVEVLKDAAAAAIYGSRAGNGVILITTKQGREGQTAFSANVSYSASYMPAFPTQIGGRLERWYNIKSLRNMRVAMYDWMTGETKYPNSYEDVYGQFSGTYDYFWNGGNDYAPIPILQDSLNSFYNNQTNWFKQMFRTGQIINANIQASGGNSKIRYMFGAGYYKESGIMVGSDFARANILMNMVAEPTSRISIYGRIYLAYGDKSRNVRSHALAPAQKFESMTSDPKTTSTLLPAGGAVEDEILKQLNGTVSKNDSYRVMSNARLGIDIIKDLNFSTSLGIDFSQANGNVFEPSYLSSRNENKSAGSVVRDISLSNENLLTYKKNFNDKHNIEILLGLTYNHQQTHELKGYALRGSSDKVYYVSKGSSGVYNYGSESYPSYQALQYYYSNFNEKAMLSYLGRLAYNYKSRYLMEFTFRRDGSSVFGEDVRWANFPAIAIGWIFSDENFMNKFSWLNLGKIRLSWGKSGQIFDDAYLAHGLMTSGASFLGNASMTSNGIINRNLTWEKSDQYDVGLDLDLFNYRLKLKMDYYYKYTKSLLYNVEIPGDFHGAGQQVQNAMEISNSGIEIEALVDIFRESEVSWRLKANFSRNWNKFKKSYNGMDVDRHVIGKPLNGVYVLLDDGFYQTDEEVPVYYNSAGVKNLLFSSLDQPYTAGMRKIIDIDGNGMIDADDEYYAGSTYPVASGGIVNELSWKNFDINILCTYSLGRRMVNNYALPSLNPNTSSNPIFYDFRDKIFWEQEGDQADLPRMNQYLGTFDGQFSGLIRSNLEKVNYLKMKQFTIGYNFSKSLAQKIHLSGIRLFITGENLFTWTNYSGMDPEVVSLENGTDSFDNYPLARKWSIGLTVNF